MGEFHIRVPWIPPADLRGNSGVRRSLRSEKYRRIKHWAENLGAIAHAGHPLRAPLSVTVRVGVGTIQDVQDNLPVGYKPFWDGLEVCGVLHNDRDIAIFTIVRECINLPEEDWYSDILIKEIDFEVFDGRSTRKTVSQVARKHKPVAGRYQRRRRR